MVAAYETAEGDASPICFPNPAACSCSRSNRSQTNRSTSRSGNRKRARLRVEGLPYPTALTMFCSFVPHPCLQVDDSPFASPGSATVDGCRVHPTCSAYFLEAVSGTARCAELLGAKRLARCHPWGGQEKIQYLHIPRSRPTASPVNNRANQFMDRQAWVAIFLCFVVLAAWQVYVMKHAPPAATRAFASPTPR